MTRPLPISRPGEQQTLLANTLARLALGRAQQPTRERQPIPSAAYYIGLGIWLGALSIAAAVAWANPAAPQPKIIAVAFWISGLLALIAAAMHDSR
jgi:hypothetical protein